MVSLPISVGGVTPKPTVAGSPFDRPLVLAYTLQPRHLYRQLLVVRGDVEALLDREDRAVDPGRRDPFDHLSRVDLAVSHPVALGPIVRGLSAGGEHRQTTPPGADAATVDRDSGDTRSTGFVSPFCRSRCERFGSVRGPSPTR